MPDFIESIIEKELLGDVFDDSDLDKKIECTFFEEICSKNNYLKDSPEKVYDHKKFISIVDKLNCSFPFLKINNFVQDYVNGVYNKDIIIKYNFTKKSDFKKCLSKTLLNCPQRREKLSSENDKSDYAKRKNLKNSQISNTYNFVLKESKYFNKELEFLYNYNSARTIFIIKQLFGKFSQEEMITDDIFRDINNNEIFKIKINEEIKKIFQNHFKELEIDLYKKNILKFSNERYEIKFNFNSIEEEILRIVTTEKNGITYEQIMNKLNEKLDFILYIPSYRLCNLVLEKYVEIGVFKVESGFQKSDPLEKRFFSKNNFVNQESIVTSGEESVFFGRKNDPFEFVNELQYLDKGDFGDEDDQVTRIAGLVLAGTQKMIGEKEKSEFFDFGVSMEGFIPTEAQIKIMSDNDMVIYPTCKIIHIKLMIYEDITLDIIEGLKSELPKDDQAMIITYQEIPESVKTKLFEDKTIQIIDKKLLFSWAETIPILPSRKGSIVKIMQGKYFGHIVKLTNIDYTTAKATVELLSTENTITEHIRNLEEIPLFDDPVQENFNVLTDNYYEFLKKMLANSSLLEFNKAIHNSDKIEESFIPPNDTWTIYEETPFVTRSKNITSTITPYGRKFDKIFDCTCDYFVKERKLCFHLISVLNELGIRNDAFNETWDTESNLISQITSIFD